MSILDRIDQIIKTVPEAGAAAPKISPDGDFTRGLRSGMTAVGGQFDAFKGGVAEAIGNKQFADEMYAKSTAAQQLAAQQGPSITSYEQVDGLRSGVKYVSGLLGASLPYTGAGLAAGAVGGLVGGPMGAISAATLATAPAMAGEAIQRQQEDPEVSLRHGAGTRLANAVGVGLGSAALENVAALGTMGKLTSAARRGAMPLAKSAAVNIPKGMVVEGSTESGQELLQQGAHTALNPNRDKSGDTAALKESAVGGALSGAPFGVVDTFADRVGYTAPERTDGVPLTGSVMDKAKGLLDSVKDKVSKKPVNLKADPKAPVNLADTLKPAAVTGDDHALDMGLPNLPEEQHEETFKKADTAAAERATGLQQKLLGNKKVSDAERQFISGLDVDDAEGQGKIDRLYDRYAQQDEHEAAMDAMVDVLAKYDEDEGVMRSNDAATPKEFYGYFDKPEFDYMNEGTKKRAAESLSRIIELAEKGKPIPAEVRRAFGDQLPAALKAAHGVTGNKDAGKREQFFKQLSSVMDEQKREGDLIAAVSESLPEHLIDRVKGPQVKAFVQQMKDYVLGNDAKDMGANEYKVHRREQEDKLQALFGDKYEQVNEAFAAWAEENAGTKERDTVEDETVIKGGPDEMTEVDEEVLRTKPVYYGGGKDKKAPTLIERAEVHRNKYGSESAAERLEGQARAENPDKTVSWISAQDYAKENNIDDATLHQMTDGRPNDFGIVVAEATKDPETLDWNEIEAMQLGRDYAETGKRSKSADLDNESRVDTGVKGVILDAQRMVKVMGKKMGYDKGEFAKSDRRLLRAFEQALASAADQLGVPITAADGTVVAIRNKTPVTYGELKKNRPMPKTRQYDKEAKQRADLDTLEHYEEQYEKAKQAIAHLEGQAPTAAGIADMREGVKLVKHAENELKKFKARMKESEKFRTERSSEEKSLEEELGLHDRTENENIHLQRMGVKDEEDTAKAFTEKEDKLAVKFDVAGNPINYATPFKTTGPDHLAKRIEEFMAKSLTSTATAKAVAKKANTLYKNFEHMTKTHQDAFAKVADAKSLSSVSGLINDLYAKYGENPGAAKQEYFDEREAVREAVAVARWAKTLAGKDEALDTNLAQVERLKDAKAVHALQRNVDALLKVEKPNANVKQLIRAYNDALSTLLDRDRELAYLIQTQHGDMMESRGPTGTGRLTQQDMRDLVNTMRTMLGNSVGFDFPQMGHAGEYHPSTPTMLGLIRISVHALNPKSVAYHESLHAFFDLLRKDGLHDLTRVLERAAKTGPVMQVLREKFAGQAAVLKQIENSYEERAAYMFQLYAERDAQMMAALSNTPKSIFGQIKNAILNALGIWTNHKRAAHIMEYFQSGEYARNMGNVDTVYADTMEKGTNKHVDFIKENAVPLQRLGTAFLVVGSERIRGYENPALTKIVDLTHRSKFDGGDDQGYIPARRIESFKRKDKMMQELDRMVPGAKAEDYNAALSAMRLLKHDANALATLTPEQRLITRVFRKTLDETFTYMRDAGVEIKDYGFGKDYAPRRWDIAAIASNEADFRAMIDRYVQAGSITGDVEAMIQRMMGNEGGDIVTDGTPKNPHAKERILKMISEQDAAPFLEKEALRTMSLYIDQATRRAEWARRFDLKDPQTMEMIPNGKYDAMLEEARTKYGATPEQIADTQKYIDGLNGMLGRDMSPTARKWIANTMIYQNLALLPLGIFSAVIDANGIMVNGGTVRESFDAFIRGVKEIKKNFESKPKDDDAYKFAEEMGVIESVMLHHAMGGTTFGMLDASPWMRKANDFLFRYNGMEQWNTSMRVGAAQAALGFLRRHADGTASPHSKRYLAELGLKVGDLQMKPDGWPMMTKQDFIDAGMSPDDATAKSMKMMFALNKWVDGAVLRPDATLKPIWMNDPRFKLFGHMKQFMFAFQETTLKRVAHEARFGNYTPIMALASYVPVMLAADVVKGLVQGAGDQPDWKDNWDGGDYFAAAVQRAGLFGVGQIGIDVLRSFKHGGYGVGALGGPTVSQLGDIALTATGDHSFQNTVIRALPANVLWGHWLDGANEG